jgi:hypothetical protein
MIFPYIPPNGLFKTSTYKAINWPVKQLNAMPKNGIVYCTRNQQIIPDRCPEGVQSFDQKPLQDVWPAS